MALIYGCTSTQLSIGTVNVASTIEEIEKNQAIANFSRIADDAFALPSLVSIVGGTVQVVNTVNPSVSFPLTSMFARVSSSSPSATTTTAGAGATVSGTISWQQNFNIVPITDPFTIRNISALYRAVVYCDPNNPGAWLGSYRRPPSPPGHARDQNSPLTQQPDMPAGYIGYQVPRLYGRFDQLMPDPYALENPNCVLCIDEDATTPQNNQQLREKTTINARVFGECWLYHSTTDSSDSPPAGSKFLGSFGNKIFYVRKGYDDAFAEFLILTLPTPAGPTRFASIIRGDKGEKLEGAQGRLPLGQPEGVNGSSILVFPGIQNPP